MRTLVPYGFRDVAFVESCVWICCDRYQQVPDTNKCLVKYLAVFLVMWGKSQVTHDPRDGCFQSSEGSTKPQGEAGTVAGFPK